MRILEAMALLLARFLNLNSFQNARRETYNTPYQLFHSYSELHYSATELHHKGAKTSLSHAPEAAVACHHHHSQPVEHFLTIFQATLTKATNPSLQLAVCAVLLKLSQLP